MVDGHSVDRVSSGGYDQAHAAKLQSQVYRLRNTAGRTADACLAVAFQHDRLALSGRVAHGRGDEPTDVYGSRAVWQLYTPAKRCPVSPGRAEEIRTQEC